MKSYQIENCITLAIVAAMTIGLYALGAGGHSFWSLVLLLNLGYERTEK